MTNSDQEAQYETVGATKKRSLSVRPSAVRNVVRGHWAGLLYLPACWRDTTCSVWSQLQCRRSSVSKSLTGPSGFPLIVKGMFQVLLSSPRPRAADVCAATRISRRYKARHGMPFHICGGEGTCVSCPFRLRPAARICPQRGSDSKVSLAGTP